MASRRIVLLGKTGAGKSSLANTILGKDLFKICHSSVSDANLSHTETKSVDGKSVKLIDTRGFFDTRGSEATLRAEILRCATECAPGPHAFLIVLKVEKFTTQEEDVVKKMCWYFSEEAMGYAVVVFTHGDQLRPEVTIEEFVGQNADLSNLVMKCGGRCHVVDNRYWKNGAVDDYRSNQFQVAALLDAIDKMIEAQGGSCFTNEMLGAVTREILREEEHIGQTSGNMSWEEITNKAKDSVFNSFLIRLASTTTGALLGALLGMAPIFFQGFSDPSAPAAAAQGTATSAALRGLVQGSQIGYDAAEGAESPGEAIGKTVKAVWKKSGFGADQSNT